MNGFEIFSYTFDSRIANANTSQYIFAINNARQNLNSVKSNIAMFSATLQTGSDWNGLTPKSYCNQINSISANNTGAIEGAFYKIINLIGKVNKYKELISKFNPLKHKFYEYEKQKKILYSQITEVYTYQIKQKGPNGKEILVDKQGTITHPDKEIEYNNVVKLIDGLIAEGSAIIKEAKEIENELL